MRARPRTVRGARILRAAAPAVRLAAVAAACLGAGGLGLVLTDLFGSGLVGLSLVAGLGFWLVDVAHDGADRFIVYTRRASLRITKAQRRPASPYRPGGPVA